MQQNSEASKASVDIKRPTAIHCMNMTNVKKNLTELIISEDILRNVSKRSKSIVVKNV